MSALLLSSSPSSPQARHIGFALDVAGAWTVNGRAVANGQAVPPGGRVRFAGKPSEAAPASITIILLNNRAIHVRCDVAGACDHDYELPTSLIATPPLLDRLTEAALTLFGSKPARYVPTLSRGADTPLDAVILFDAGRLAMAPCLAEMRPGRYRIEFSDLRNATTPARRVASVELTWTEGQPADVQARDVQQGLYEIRVIQLPQETSSMAAWVLVLGTNTYSQAASDYRALEQAVSQWDPTIAGRLRRTFLRAGLDSLARTYQ